MRLSADVLGALRCPSHRHPGLAGAEHAVRRRPCAASCQLGPLLLCRDGPIVELRRAAPSSRSRSCDDRCRASPSGRVEAGLLRRLPAHPPLDCEDELPPWPGRSIAHFTEASSVKIEGPYDVSLVERIDHRAGRPPHRRDPRGVEGPGRHRGVRHAGGSRPCANFADVAEFTSVVYARPDYIATLATSTPVATTSRSTSSCAAARSTSVSWLELLTPCWRAASPRSRRTGRLLRLQAARHPVRHGGPRHPLPRAGRQGRVRRHLPLPSTGLLPLGPVAMNPNPGRPDGLSPPPRDDEQEVGRVSATFNAASPALDPSVRSP